MSNTSLLAEIIPTWDTNSKPKVFPGWLVRISYSLLVLVGYLLGVVDQKYPDKLLGNQANRPYRVAVADAFRATHQRRVFKMWLNEDS